MKGTDNRRTRAERWTMQAVTCQGMIHGISPRGEVGVDPLYSWSVRGPHGKQERGQVITQLGRTAALGVGYFQ
jgi:hypothetical protein